MCNILAGGRSRKLFPESGGAAFAFGFDELTAAEVMLATTIRSSPVDFLSVAETETACLQASPYLAGRMLWCELKQGAPAGRSSAILYSGPSRRKGCRKRSAHDVSPRAFSQCFETEKLFPRSGGGKSLSSKEWGVLLIRLCRDKRSHEFAEAVRDRRRAARRATLVSLGLTVRGGWLSFRYF